jgi:hypothetical protein
MVFEEEIVLESEEERYTGKRGLLPVLPRVFRVEHDWKKTSSSSLDSFPGVDPFAGVAEFFIAVIAIWRSFWLSSRFS